MNFRFLPNSKFSQQREKENKGSGHLVGVLKDCFHYVQVKKTAKLDGLPKISFMLPNPLQFLGAPAVGPWIEQQTEFTNDKYVNRIGSIVFPLVGYLMVIRNEYDLQFFTVLSIGKEKNFTQQTSIEHPLWTGHYVSFQECNFIKHMIPSFGAYSLVGKTPEHK